MSCYVRDWMSVLVGKCNMSNIANDDDFGYALVYEAIEDQRVRHYWLMNKRSVIAD